MKTGSENAREARQDIEANLKRIRALRNDDVVRQILHGLNQRVREAIKSLLPNPPIVVLPVDVEDEVNRWREAVSRS